ncbi:MAG: DUF58 domain-containing protein [Firmicutes bacterium]|nr:DUF58 domain-containing protein [Bacillota bacterium]
MLLKARFVVEGFIAGLHQSPYRGFSLEFAQHREYSPGDETRHIDWKVYGRKDKYFVKQYQEETNLKGYILLDRSASMGYKSKEITKLQYGSYLAASLAFLMLKQQDSVGLVTFDERIKKYIPPRQSKGHLSLILEELEKLVPSSQTGINRSLQELGQYTKRRGLIILISDLLDEQEKVLNALKYFRFKKHEVIVFHLLDPAEMELPFTNVLWLEDMENGKRVLTHPQIIREKYKSVVKEFVETYKLSCLRSDIDYCLMDTKTPLDFALGTYLARRKMLR